MARAKMSEIHNAPPNLKSMDQVDEIPEEYWDRYYREMHLKILDDRHLVEENFKKKYAKARVLLRDHRLSSNALMLKVIDSEITVESALNKIYSNNQPGRLINISPTCRGCPKKPEGYSLTKEPSYFESYVSQNNSANLFRDTWGDYFDGKTVIIFYERSKGIK